MTAYYDRKWPGIMSFPDRELCLWWPSQMSICRYLIWQYIDIPFIIPSCNKLGISACPPVYSRAETSIPVSSCVDNSILGCWYEVGWQQTHKDCWWSGWRYCPSMDESNIRARSDYAYSAGISQLNNFSRIPVGKKSRKLYGLTVIGWCERCALLRR